MSHHDVTMLLVALGVLLLAARMLGELAQRFHQPSVAGEILAGILLGPTFFGAIWPSAHEALFPETGPLSLVFSGMTTLAITLFLLSAGMEVDLSSAFRQGRVAAKVSLLGLIVPFAMGFAAAWFAPHWMGAHPEAERFIFALFIGTALSISALPVIAKTLMDLNLYRSDLGMVIISAAVLNDLIGWIIFALMLGMMGATTGGLASVGVTITLTLLFAALMLTVVRWGVHRALPYIQAYTHWPGGVLSFALSLALLAAAATEWIGVHAIFGAFLAGVAIGDSHHLRERTRATIDTFASFIFAPLFFASIGLHLNFLTHFEPRLVLTVLVLACVGKLLGCWIGGKWAGLERRDIWAVGFGMNARGAMEIILGLLALRAGVIAMPLFVALVVMAIATSMMSGPFVQRILGRRKSRHVAELLMAQRFIPKLTGVSRADVIRQLVDVACAGGTLDPQQVLQAVLAREETMHTGIGNGVAIPHARLPQLTAPIVALGISESGVDFDARDGQSAGAVFLLLTPVEDGGAQLEIVASLARTFRKPETLSRVQQAGNLTEILAILKSESKHPGATR